MNFRFRHFASLLLALCCAFATLEAAARSLAVDMAASKVTFAVRATAHSFVGTVDQWTLDLTVPDGASIPDSARFSADVVALKTGKDARDRDMLRWIDNATHPKIQFALSKISPVSGDTYTAEGELSLHGVTKTIMIPISIQPSGEKLTISGEVTIDDRQFGLSIIRKFGMLTVAPEVKVAFNVTGVLH